MSSYVRNMDTGKQAKNRGDDYLPSWSNDINAIAQDNERFAQEVGVSSGRRGAAANDNTNHLGLRRTRQSNRQVPPPNSSASFRGGQNQTFRQGRGEESLHGQVQKSTGIAKGTVSSARRNLNNSSDNSLSRKKITTDLELSTETNSKTRGRIFRLTNTGNKDVELTLNFQGSEGVTVDDNTTMTKTVVVSSGTQDVLWGSISIAPGRAAVKMALAVKTLVSSTSAVPAGMQQRSPQPTCRTAIATHNFAAAEEDECDLNEGDEVQLLSEDTNGWTSILNLTSGDTGLSPSNHFEIGAIPKSISGSLNNIYTKSKTRRGSWVGGNGNGAVIVKKEASVPVTSNVSATKVRCRGSIKRNSVHDWDDGTTNAKATHVKTGKRGMILGEADGLTIIQFDDGTVGSVPSDEISRINRGAGDGGMATKTVKKITRRVIERPASTETTATREYLTDRAIDGIRVNHVTGAVRKAKASHPQQKGLDKFRGKGGPPPVPKKSWKTFGRK